MGASGKPVVYYTHWVPDAGYDVLRPYCELIEPSTDYTPSAEEIARFGREAAALCYFVPDCIDAGIIAACPQLRILAGFGKGYDNVDVAAATARGVWVTNVPDGLTEATADLAWALLLALARNLPSADAFVRGGSFRGWHQRRFLGGLVHGKTLGIIGFGRIGRAIARRALGFEMAVLYDDPVRAPSDLERALRAEPAARERLLQVADYVVLAAPLNDATRQAIAAPELALMKPGAYLVNVARGSLVDEAAVAAALQMRRIAGFAADVFAMEDHQEAGHPSRVDPALGALREHTVLSPHLGTAIMETRVDLARVQARCVLAALRGQRPEGAVNEVPLQPPIL